MANLKSAILPIVSKLRCSPILGGNDLNLNNPTWEEADFKICILLTGDFFSKSTSSTITQLTSLIREGEKSAGKMVYVDFAYQATAADVKVFKRYTHRIPTMFGWSSFQSLDEFDALFASFSVHFECMSFCTALWDAKIPAYFNDRVGTKSPLVVAGGVIAGLLEPLMGHPKGPLLDLVYIGGGEDRVPNLVQTLMSMDREWTKDRINACKMLVGAYDNLYFPAGYEHIYEGNVLKEIRRKYDWVPEKVKVYRSFNPRPPMFEQKVLVCDNEDASRGELEISHGCVGFGSCYFCQEGNEQGPWRENDYETILHNLEVTKHYCAPNSISFYSLNSNFMSRVFDLYEEVSKRFSYVTVIAFRADVLSEVPEYIRLLKTLGVFRCTLAVEGVSERVRRDILNKNLSWDQFFKVAENVFKDKFTLLKINMIVTGYETEEDVQEFCDAMSNLNEIRERCGAKTGIDYSLTQLVTYPNTALQWMPRKAILGELFKDRLLKRISSKARELGHRVRYHSGLKFVMQQLIVEGGRQLSEVAFDTYRNYWESGKSIYHDNFYEEITDKFMTKLGISSMESKQALLGSEDEFKEASVERKSSEAGGYLTPENDFRLTQIENKYRELKEKYEKPIRDYFDRHFEYNHLFPWGTLEILPEYVRKTAYATVGKRGLNYCLKSPSNLSPKCKSCGYCGDDKYSLERITGRNIDSKKKVDDIELAIFNNKPLSSARIVYAINTDDLSRMKFKIVLNHTMAAMLLRGDTELTKAFHSCSNYSDSPLTVYGQHDSWGGLGYFDVNMRLTVEELKERLQAFDPVKQINSNIQSARAIRVMPKSYVDMGMRPLKALWRIATPIAKDTLNDAFCAWDGQLMTCGKGSEIVLSVLTEKWDRSEFDLLLVQRPRDSLIYLAMDARINPFMAIWSLFGIKPEKSRGQFRFERIAIHEMLDIHCKACNKTSGIDLLTGEIAPCCITCTGKIVAKRNLR